MGKGDGPNPGEEFFYKLSLRQEFQQDILSARKQLGILERGLASEDDRIEWLSANKDKAFNFMGIELGLKERYKIPLEYWIFISEYIFFGESRGVLKSNIAPVVIDEHAHEEGDRYRYGDIEGFYRETGEPYAKLFILGTASKTGVINFINKNWGKIEDVLDVQRGQKRKRVRKTTNKERNRLIKELWRKSAKELRQEADSRATDKEILISKILKVRGFGNIDEGYIRKMSAKKQA